MTCLSASLPETTPEDPSGRDKRGKDGADSGSGANPLGAFGIGGEFNMADLGQIFTRLGEMFGGVGTAMAAGKTSGPVNYDLARQVASSSIGFISAHPGGHELGDRRRGASGRHLA